MAVIEEIEAEDNDLQIVKLDEFGFHVVSTSPTPNNKPQHRDPKAIARRYQLMLCQKAKEENVIVYLETGCGKTLIAVLLMQEFADVIRKPGKNVCVFLAPTVPLVEQQAKVIEQHSDFKVGRYFGEAKHASTAHQEWTRELEKHEVLVMTPDILLHNLHHCFMKMELIELLIFDECHHAQKRHPYAQIMKEFYFRDKEKHPRIFGMTASPIMGKGGSNQLEYAKGIRSLEQLLDAKVYTVVDRSELDTFVPSPVMKVYYYDHINNVGHASFSSCRQKLDECKDKYISLVFGCCNGEHMDSCRHDFRGNLKKTKAIMRSYGDLVYCLDDLGLCSAKQAAKILLDEERNEYIDRADVKEDSVGNHVSKAFLTDAFLILDSSFVKGGDYANKMIVENALKEPFFSSKLIALLEILSMYRNKKDMKCIVFVKRIITARLLAWVISHQQHLHFWRCDFLVGYHSGLKVMSRTKMNQIVENFRSGKVNLLVTTNVAEEGLDIQTCCLVVRFDLPSTVASFIQSRGRARMQESNYIFLVERGSFSQESLVQHFICGEEHMRREVQHRTPEGGDPYEDEEDQIYQVDITQATVSTGCSVSLLHHYCSKLSGDEYFIPTPEFSYFSEPGGVMCRISLPSNAPIRQVDGPTCPSGVKAKRVACLEACKLLHSMGALNHYLLPEEDEEDEEVEISSSDPHKHGGVNSRSELYEMLVPNALQGVWNTSAKPVSLHAYFLKFTPIPSDREYTRFALFLESALPREAATMKVELHLARGRIVKTELLPWGIMEFDPLQLKDGVKFQEVFLGIMLDRTKFQADYVALGSEDLNSWSSSTLYLLLPLQPGNDKDEMSIDWKMVKDCLSSPVFDHPAKESSAAVVSSNLPQKMDSLRLVNGWVDMETIRNSLVVTWHNGTFYCIVEILHELNAYSKFPKTKECSYADYYKKKYDVTLHYMEQPLLKAKPLLNIHNLLHDRSQVNPGDAALMEYFVELPPELCCVKLVGFSSPLASAVSLLPSTMHRLENLLVAIELKDSLAASFPEGNQVTANRILEALTTERCMEGFSLERLEVLGDAFLKYVVSRHLFLVHDTLDEGQLTRKRSNIVKNTSLYKRAIRMGLQAYIRDEYFDPKKYVAPGRPCNIVCSPEEVNTIHYYLEEDSLLAKEDDMSVKCTKQHHWLHMKTIADVVEALLGAYLIDSGFKAALAFLKWIGIELDFEPSLIGDACNRSKQNLSLIDSINIVDVEKLLEYKFIYKGLLLEALTHPSYNEHNGGCYQRLEFLGDAVLDYVITSYLYSVYPDLNPGQLTDMRSMNVNNESFAHVAAHRRLYSYIIEKSDNLSSAITKYVNFLQASSALDKDSNDELEPKCPKVLGDLVESLAGALLVDTGFNLQHVWNLMLNFLEPIVSPEKLRLHPVRELTELCERHNLKLDYLEERNGFSVQAKVSGKNLTVVGTGKRENKKGAKKFAARDALAKLKVHGIEHSSKILEILINCQKREAVLIGNDEGQALTEESMIAEKLEALEFNSSQASSSHTFSGVRRTGTGPHAISSDFIPSTKVPLKKNALAEHDQHSSPSSLVVDHGMRSNVQNEEKQTNIVSLTSATQVADEHQHTNSCRDCDMSANTTSEYHCRSANCDTGKYQFLGSAKASLHEFCAKKNWEEPVFVCCKEEGLPHVKRFTYVVVLRLPGDISVECLGEPMTNKKLAKESAARGTLWWLASQGYLQQMT